MIAVLRIALTIGLGYAAFYAVLFILRRRRSDLSRALAAFAITAVLSLIFFLGMAAERLTSDLGRHETPTVVARAAP